MPTLAETIATACGKAVAAAIADAKTELTDIAVAGGDAASNGLLGDVKDVTSILSNLLGDIPIIGGLLADAADPLHAVEDAAGKFGRGFGLGYVIGYIGSQLATPLMLPLIHEVNAHTTNLLFDPETAAGLVVKGIIGTDQGRSESSGGGLDVPHFDDLVAAAVIYPALGETLRLLNMQLITEDQAALFLTRQGVPAEHQDKLLALRRMLLSPADLALATLRGEMTAEVMQGYADQLGVTADDMAVLIGNTGEPPGLMQMLEAYRRDFIDKDRLERGIRQSRVRDEWIDVVEDLRYAPMSTADAITAAVRNYITSDQARAIADQNGLIPAQFDTLLAAHGRPIATGEALELLNRGLMTADQVKEVVRQSDVKDEYVDDVLQLARRLIPYRTINTILTHGVRDKAWGVSYLQLLGYSADDADALAATATTAKTAALKQITEAQILDLYEAKAITKDQANELLLNVGYDSDESAYVLDATEAKQSLAEQKKAIAAVRAAYLANRISKADASNQLDALQVMSDQRDLLLKDWVTEKAGIVKTPTEGQLTSAVYYGILTYDAAKSRLMDLGYSQEDAILVIDVRLHGLQPGEPTIEGQAPSPPPTSSSSPPPAATSP